jgi:hypothetical protein
MVNGRIARACAACAGVVASLLVACGGQSVSKSGDDPANAGSSGKTASSGGTSSGGGTAGTSGIGHDGGAPSKDQLEDQCTLICARVSAPTCGDLDYASCAENCVHIVGAGTHSLACSRAFYDYFGCIEDLRDICTLNTAPVCEGDSNDAIECVTAYCQSSPDDLDCKGIYSGS